MVEPAFDPQGPSGGLEGDWASQLAGLLDVVLCLLLITILATAVQALQIRELPRLLEMRERQAALRAAVQESIGAQGVSGFSIIEEGQLEVRLIDKLAREGERVGGGSGHLLHDERQHAHPLARVAGVLPVLGQIERRAADRCSLM